MINNLHPPLKYDCVCIFKTFDNKKKIKNYQSSYLHTSHLIGFDWILWSNTLQTTSSLSFSRKSAKKMKRASVAVSVRALVAARGIPASAHVTLTATLAHLLVLRFSLRFSRKRPRRTVHRAIELSLRLIWGYVPVIWHVDRLQTVEFECTVGRYQCLLLAYMAVFITLYLMNNL